MYKVHKPSGPTVTVYIILRSARPNYTVGSQSASGRDRRTTRRPWKSANASGQVPTASTCNDRRGSLTAQTNSPAHAHAHRWTEASITGNG